MITTGSQNVCNLIIFCTSAAAIQTQTSLTFQISVLSDASGERKQNECDGIDRRSAVVNNTLHFKQITQGFLHEAETQRAEPDKARSTKNKVPTAICTYARNQFPSRHPATHYMHISVFVICNLITLSAFVHLSYRSIFVLSTRLKICKHAWSFAEAVRGWNSASADQAEIGSRRQQKNVDKMEVRLEKEIALVTACQ